VTSALKAAQVYVYSLHARSLNVRARFTLKERARRVYTCECVRVRVCVCVCVCVRMRACGVSAIQILGTRNTYGVYAVAMVSRSCLVTFLKCRALFKVYWALFGMNGSLFRICRALFRISRVLCHACHAECSGHVECIMSHMSHGMEYIQWPW